MGAASVALRGLLNPRARARENRHEAVSEATGLAFDRTPGAVVAVCGLAGGCGTTTLAHLVAAQAARESSGPVLLCESEAPLGGLAVVAGASSAHGLAGVADLTGETGTIPDLPVTWLTDRLALLAAPPRPRPPVPETTVAAVLEHARATYPLVVVDCRTPDHPHCAAALSVATHVLWTLPASSATLESFLALTRTGLLPVAPEARHALIANAVRPAPAASVRDLHKLTDDRHERLVLIPHIEEIHEPAVARGERVLFALTQLATLLRSGTAGRRGAPRVGAT